MALSLDTKAGQCKPTFDGHAKKALGFFNLPPEIREQVYKILLRSANHRYYSTEGPYYQFDLRILRVNRLIHDEANKVFKDNIFVKITIPWQGAISHINSEGNVAIVARDQRASDFQDYHLRAYIDPPDTAPWNAHTGETYSMITCIQEVKSFTQIWYLSNLSNARQLNPHLRLRLDLKNPRFPGERIPKVLQQRLILPFGEVKDLHSMEFNFHGKPFFGYAVDKDVQETVIKAQKIPAPTPEECIEKALARKKAGNDEMQAKAYAAALKEYFDAFAAIHIFIKGRVREIRCDAYYNQVLESGAYQGQHGHHMRMTLRIQLVANVVLAYIKMENWDEAYFWGRRSITTFRLSMTGVDEIGGRGWEEWVAGSLAINFGAKNEMGKLFYRTALAARNMEPDIDAAKNEENIDSLIMAAGVYLPNDPIVQTEVNAVRMRQRVRQDCLGDL